MRFRLRLLPLAAGLLVAAPTLALPSAASAALDWRPCTASSFQCTTLAVPLDRTGTVAGSIGLSATRKAAASNPTRTAVVALAGGPGQAAQPFAEDFAAVLKPGLAERDLVVFDQRGTGKSGALSCPALRRTGNLDSLIGRCSDELGARRGFFRTADSVEDLEALRVAGGYDQLVLYGVSYGTKVALAYAAAHPAAVQSMVLDSVVLPEGPDALRSSTAKAVTRVIGDDLCGRKACKAATPAALSDLRKLAAQLERRSMKATVYSGSGRAFTASLGVNGLLDLITAGDLNPALRAALPAAVRSARKGDRQPLLRLSANAAGLDNGNQIGRTGLQTDDEELGDGSLYLATVCEEDPTFPWTRGAPLQQRANELVAAVRAAPEGTWGLFPRRVGLGGVASTCLGWKVASPAPPAPGPLPNVPTLVLTGSADVRTPTEDAELLTARLPQTQLLRVPHTGHSVLTSEYGDCALTGLSTFLRGGAVSPCMRAATPFEPTRRAPRSLSDISPARRLPAKVGRTLNVLPAALQDARQQILGAILASGQAPKSLGGLRGGSVRVFSEKHWQLRSYELIRGVRISGHYYAERTSTYTFSGSKGASGRITVSRSGRATGRLGGARVNSSPRAAAANSKWTGLTFADALRSASGPR